MPQLPQARATPGGNQTERPSENPRIHRKMLTGPRWVKKSLRFAFTTTPHLQNLQATVGIISEFETPSPLVYRGKSQYFADQKSCKSSSVLNRVRDCLETLTTEQKFTWTPRVCRVIFKAWRVRYTLLCLHREETSQLGAFTSFA